MWITQTEEKEDKSKYPNMRMMKMITRIMMILMKIVRFLLFLFGWGFNESLWMMNRIKQNLFCVKWLQADFGPQCIFKTSISEISKTAGPGPTNNTPGRQTFRSGGQTEFCYVLVQLLHRGFTSRMSFQLHPATMLKCPKQNFTALFLPMPFDSKYFFSPKDSAT